MKEFERRISSPKKVLRQIQKTAKGKVRESATLLLKNLDDSLLKVRFNLPYGGVKAILELLGSAERAKTLEDFLKLNLSDGKVFEFLTVKGHNVVLSSPLVRTEFEVDPDKRRYLLRLLKDIEEEEQRLSLGLRPLKDFLRRGRIEHIDLTPSEVERILIIPPLCWDYEGFDPSGVINFDVPSELRSLLKAFLGEVGNFHPEGGKDYEKPFGLTDLDKNLFDEVNKNFLRGGDLILSSEVNMLEFLL